MSLFGKTKFTKCPSPKDLAPMVLDSITKNTKHSMVVSRQTVLSDVKNSIRGRKVLSAVHVDKKGAQSLQIDHMIDLTLSMLKKKHYIETAVPGAYMPAEGMM